MSKDHQQIISIGLIWTSIYRYGQSNILTRFH